MNPLQFLTSDDFRLFDSQKGKVMCTGLKGISLILFYSKECDHCKKLLPIFKQLPFKISGCQFAIVNVSEQKECILMSQQTIAPLIEVPYILLYFNGRPYIRYRGVREINEIANFIKEIGMRIMSEVQKGSDRIQENTNGINVYTKHHQNPQNPQNPQNLTSQKECPEGRCTTGNPLCGEDDDVCYLEFSEAYSSGNHLLKVHPTRQSFDDAYKTKPGYGMVIDRNSNQPLSQHNQSQHNQRQPMQQQPYQQRQGPPNQQQYPQQQYPPPQMNQQQYPQQRYPPPQMSQQQYMNQQQMNMSNQQQYMNQQQPNHQQQQRQQSMQIPQQYLNNQEYSQYPKNNYNPKNSKGNTGPRPKNVYQSQSYPSAYNASGM